MEKGFTILMFVLLAHFNLTAQNVFSVKGNKTYLNGDVIQCIGLRCSNALLSDKTVDELINHLDEYRGYGMNAISVYFMGSRYSNIYGFLQDGSLDPVYRSRMEKIVEACDRRKMVVLIGILYWGSGQSNLANKNYDKWGQEEVNNAMAGTVKWLTEKRYRNVFIDPDNEGMAERAKKFDIASMISAGKKVNQSVMIAYNGQAEPPAVADLTIHYGRKLNDKPYIQSEGTPDQYWGEYSKEAGLNEYINVGIYTTTKKEQQLASTRELLDRGDGYLFASTWLQNVPPNYSAGGDGSPCNPGIKWWCSFIKDNYKKH